MVHLVATNSFSLGNKAHSMHSWDHTMCQVVAYKRLHTIQNMENNKTILNLIIT